MKTYLLLFLEIFSNYFYSTQLILNRKFIIVYQAGKVGSSTIYSSLRKKYLTFQMHRILEKNCDKNLDLYASNYTISSHGKNVELYSSAICLFTKTRFSKRVRIPSLLQRIYLNSAKCLRNVISNKLKNAKIITLVRDPFERNISTFFQLIETFDIIDENVEYDFDTYAKVFSSKVNHYNILNWFDNEFFISTNVNIYNHPFNKEKGYSKISQSGLEILIIRLENLDKVFNEAMLEIGVNNLKLVNKNVTNEKKTYFDYLDFKKNVSFPYEFIKEVEKSNYFNHFYSPIEKNQIISKWMKRIHV